MGIRMDYGEEAELIIRLLVERGAELGVTHMRGDSNYYRHDCDNLPFSKIAHNLWNTEDSILHVRYEEYRDGFGSSSVTHSVNWWATGLAQDMVSLTSQ